MTTHSELIVKAERWLRNSAWVTPQHPSSPRHVKDAVACSVVLTEPSGAMEQPDVVGWCHGGRTSVVIECKVSRSDFATDKKKWHRVMQGRRPALGHYRFYLTTAGLITTDELPCGWGLLEVIGRRIKVMRQTERHERGVTDEMNLLWSECRKIQFVERGRTLDTAAGRRIAEALGKHKGV